MLDCGKVGSSGVITSIDFASFGTPQGICGGYGSDSICYDQGNTALTIVKQQCLGKSICQITPSTKLFGDIPACEKQLKWLSVQATCSEMPEISYEIEVNIPVGSVAEVYVDRLDLSQVTVTEDRTNVIWKDNRYTPNSKAKGITNGYQSGNKVVFTVGSGKYLFQMNGKRGDRVCISSNTTTTSTTVDIGCPYSNQTISSVIFASYGTPTGECGRYQVSGCNAGSSVAHVERYCLYQNKCTIPLGDDSFGLNPENWGNECGNSQSTHRWLNAEVVCSS